MAEKKLNIKVRTKGAKKSKRDLKGVEGGMKRLGKVAAKAGAAFFAASGIINGFKKIVDLAAQQELAEKKLEASLGKVSQALLDQASALQRVSMFGDEQIIEAQALIAAFVKEEDAIKKATQASIDLAAAKGMDLAAAADLVSKTLGSSTNAMSRYGIAVEGAVGSTARLDSLVGNIADKFGGQAKAQTDTLAGSMNLLSKSVGDLGENLGERLITPIGDTALALQFITEKTQALVKQEDDKKGLGFWASKVLKIINPLSPVLDATGAGIKFLADKQRELNQAEAESPTKPEAQIQATIFLTEEKQKQITADFNAAQLKIKSQKEQLVAHGKMAEFASQTAISLGTSALMGDNVTESLKRAVIQLMIMVAQAKLYDFFMNKATGGTSTVSAAIVNFLFGKSPTQTSPSPNGGSSNITVNNNISGFGTIDHNFAANSLIPAINKAISTGQARIG